MANNYLGALTRSRTFVDPNDLIGFADGTLIARLQQRSTVLNFYHFPLPVLVKRETTRIKRGSVVRVAPSSGQTAFRAEWSQLRGPRNAPGSQEHLRSATSLHLRTPVRKSLKA